MPRFLDEIQYYDSNGTLRTVGPSVPLYLHCIKLGGDNWLIALSLMISLSSPINNSQGLISVLNNLNKAPVAASGVYKTSTGASPLGVVYVRGDSLSNRIYVMGYNLETGGVASEESITSAFGVDDVVTSISS